MSRLNNFYLTIDKIEQNAEKIGKSLNNKIVKIYVGITFGIMVLVFGSLVFFSKFIRSLFGFKN